MEKIINKKLNEYLVLNNVISPFQSGSRRGDSTVNQLLLMNHEFSKALDENKEIRIVFCDISRAFDRVWHKGLLFKLRSIGISENIIGWFKDYLSNRQQRVCIKGVAWLWKFIAAGVPQGSILGATKLCSIQKLYDDTGIQTLQKRRNNNKLFQLYKILNGLTPQYLQSLIPQRVQNISRYQLRNMNNFNVPPARTVTHANSFLPSTLRDWNSLDLIVHNSPTLNSFKRQLDQTRNEHPYPKYFDIVHTSRSGQIYHSRLRLECSKLKYHLYTKNIVQESRCSCGAKETTSHYLLSCDLYRNQRLHYLYLIPQPLSVPKLLFGIPEATTEENNFIFKQVQLYILATKRFAMPSS